MVTLLLAWLWYYFYAFLWREESILATYEWKMGPEGMVHAMAHTYFIPYSYSFIGWFVVTPFGKVESFEVFSPYDWIFLSIALLLVIYGAWLMSAANC